MTLISFSEFPPSLSAPVLPAALSGELNAAALVPMNAFLLQLLPLRPFAEAVLQPDLRELKHLTLVIFSYHLDHIDSWVFFGYQYIISK